MYWYADFSSLFCQDYQVSYGKQQHQKILLFFVRESFSLDFFNETVDLLTTLSQSIRSKGKAGHSGIRRKAFCHEQLDLDSTPFGGVGSLQQTSWHRCAQFSWNRAIGTTDASLGDIG